MKLKATERVPYLHTYIPINILYYIMQMYIYIHTYANTDKVGIVYELVYTHRPVVI